MGSGPRMHARPCSDARAFLRPQQHRFTYNEPMPLESVTQSLCDLALRFGEDSEEGGLVSLHGMYSLHIAAQTLLPGLHAACCRHAVTTCNLHAPLAPPQSRPFGVALLIAGWDDQGPAL